jgi:hypothetical protein
VASYESLLAQAGFARRTVIPLIFDVSVLECEPV